MRMKAQVLALAVLLLPAGLAAQQAAPMAPATSPIERLLQRRTDLALTQHQVQQLEGIRQKSADRERDLVGKITQARGLPPGVPIRTQAATPEQRQALRDKGQPYMNELRQLHTQQMQEARAVLTAQQNAQAWGRGGQCCGAGPGSMRGAGGAGRGSMRGTGMGPRRR